MSIQFRSRVKSVVDFGADLKHVGTCCYTDATSESITFYECFIKNGTFIPGLNASCPEQGSLGNCFSCAYLTTSQRQQVIANPSILTSNPTWGTKTVTECECNRIGGKFHPTNAIDPNVPGRDIRIPKGCCFFEYNESGFPIGITCDNVCSEKECSLRGSPYDNGNLRHNSVYHPDALCSTVACNPTTIQANFFADMALGSKSYASFDIGACYELSKDTAGYTYECNLKTLHDCPGYWISPNYGENSVIMCDNPYAPQTPVISDGRAVEPEIMNESDFDLLGIQVGDEYKGGYYIGKFITNSSSSPVYGSLNLQGPVEQYYNDNTPRDIYTKWALIVDYTDYNTSLMTSSEMSARVPVTSNSDGFYTCYGNKTDFFGYGLSTINSAKGMIRNGFPDYYVPSIIELYYLANAIRNNPDLELKLGIENKLTSSSIFFENISSLQSGKYSFNGIVFSYAQTINTSRPDFGQTVLMPGTSNGTIRFFRKVILI